MGDNEQLRVGMYPSETQIEAEKKTRLRPLQAAVKARADLSSEAVVELVKKAIS